MPLLLTSEMNSAFDPESARKILLDGVKKGHWTVEHIDMPPPYHQHVVNELLNGMDHPEVGHQYQTVKLLPYRNLLRD